MCLSADRPRRSSFREVRHEAQGRDCRRSRSDRLGVFNRSTDSHRHDLQHRAATSRAGCSESPHPERLRVERVRVAAAYVRGRCSSIASTRCATYRTPTIPSFADPGPMLSNRIAEWLAAARKTIQGDRRSRKAPRQLFRCWKRPSAGELRGDFGGGWRLSIPPSPSLSIRFTIIDEGSARPKVAYERSLSRRVPVSRATPEALVSGYGRALADILTQLAADLSNSTLQ